MGSESRAMQQVFIWLSTVSDSAKMSHSTGSEVTHAGLASDVELIHVIPFTTSLGSG